MTPWFTVRPPRLPRQAGFLAALGCWVLLFAPAVRWLAAVTFAHRNYRVNLLLLCAVAAALLSRLLRRRDELCLGAAPALDPLPLCLCLLSALAHLANAYTLHMS